MSDGQSTPPGSDGAGASTLSAASIDPKPPSTRERIIEALMELSAEREWNDFSLSDVAERAGVSLGEFRESFPSKGAVLAGLSRKLDRTVLDGTKPDLLDETAKERLFDALMRRLDAMTPYKLGLEGVADWVRKDPVAAAALNAVALNSMRFMLEAAGINTDKRLGTLKIQGLVLAWTRVLDVWFKDGDTGLARTMAALDRELSRGETMSSRLDDLDRLISPVRLLARGMLNAGQRLRDRERPRSRRLAEDDTDVRPTV